MRLEMLGRAGLGAAQAVRTVRLHCPARCWWLKADRT